MLLLVGIFLPLSCKKDKKPTPETSLMVSTFAGTGVEGAPFKDGALATFNLPGGVAVDQAGTVYVADTDNNRIRKISKEGVVSTLAGTGQTTFADGKVDMATFNHPQGVAVDAAGIVYVADTNNHRIRKITQVNGQVEVSTLAGTGDAAFNNGVGAQAKFKLPYGVAVDVAGIVYVADTYNNRIRKISSPQAGPVFVSTLAGSGDYDFAEGAGTLAKFKSPTGIAVDAQGTIYVADTDNQKIRKIDPISAKVTVLAGSDIGLKEGTGTAAKFWNPGGIAVDTQGYVYIADTGNNRVRKITPTGEVSTLAGSGNIEDAGFANGKAANAEFNNPYGIAVDKDGKVYVADTYNNQIRKIE